MLTCKECGVECSAANALGYHLRKHQMKYCDYLVKHEHNNVWPECKTCKKKLRLKKGGFGTFCSRSCSSAGENNGMFGKTGEASANFGKVRTEEHKKRYRKAAKQRWVDIGDRIRETFSSEPYKQMQREAQLTSYVNDPTRKLRTSISVNKFWASDTEETHAARKAASERAIDLLEQGKIGPQAPFKQGWLINPFTKKSEHMHSSWETAFLDKCLKEGYAVIKKHDVRISYTMPDGSRHTYVPDFVSLSEKHVIEVKGHMDESDIVKLNASAEWAKRNGYKVTLWSPYAEIVVCSQEPGFRPLESFVHDEQTATMMTKYGKISA